MVREPISFSEGWDLTVGKDDIGRGRSLRGILVWLDMGQVLQDKMV